MPQKGTIAVITLVIVLLIIIAGIGGYYLLGLDPVKQRTPASDLSNSGCTQISEFVIQQKNLTKIASCTEKEFAVNGQKVYFVNIGFGEPMDCPSGCIQASYSAIIENDKVIDFGSLREDFLDIAINTKTSKLCNSKQPNELTLIKDGEQYKWKISFNNEDSRLCQLSGYATVEGGSESFDLTNLKAEVQELDCSNLETLEEICSNIPDIATNCATDENKKEACLYLKGISKGIDCYDRLVAKRKCGEIHTGAPNECDDVRISRNYCYRSKAEIEGNLEVCDLIDDVYLLDGCYTRLAITLKDSSICFKRELSDFWRQVCY